MTLAYAVAYEVACVCSVAYEVACVTLAYRALIEPYKLVNRALIEAACVSVAHAVAYEVACVCSPSV